MHRLSLQDFDSRMDIHKFFQSCFSTIYDENIPLLRYVPHPWPSESDITTLVEKSDGLFIFAITLMNFIRSGGGLPQDNLQRALAAEANLDTLYQQILSAAVPNHNFNRVIGTIILLRESFSITSLRDLLRLQAELIVQALLGTQSIIMIPGDDDQPIQLIHTSLRDFLTMHSCSGEYFVDPLMRHLFITADCLAAMMVWPKDGVVYDGGQKYACSN
jgi:hypothetical protein